MTAAAESLNSVFAGFDGAILGALHSIANPVFTVLFKILTFLGEKGILFFLVAIGLMLFKKTRPLGVCIFGAVACGALITNIILKDAVARPRPLTVEPFMSYWKAVGSPFEDGFSFPSGHATSTAAFFTALCLMQGKKWVLPGSLVTLFMMIGRNYLMAHYPTDVITGALIGVASAFIAWFITRQIFYYLKKYEKKNAFASFLYNYDFDFSPSSLKKIGYVGKHEKTGDK